MHPGYRCNWWWGILCDGHLLSYWHPPLSRGFFAGQISKNSAHQILLVSVGSTANHGLRHSLTKKTHPIYATFLTLTSPPWLIATWCAPVAVTDGPRPKRCGCSPYIWAPRSKRKVPPVPQALEARSWSQSEWIFLLEKRWSTTAHGIVKLVPKDTVVESIFLQSDCYSPWFTTVGLVVEPILQIC